MKDSLLAHRKGRIELPFDLFKNELELLPQVMKDAVIFRAELMAITNHMVYEMIHPTFRALDWGEALPVYDVVIDTDDDTGQLKSVEFIERVNQSTFG